MVCGARILVWRRIERTDKDMIVSSSGLERVISAEKKDERSNVLSDGRRTARWVDIEPMRLIDLAI